MHFEAYNKCRKMKFCLSCRVDGAAVPTGMKARFLNCPHRLHPHQRLLVRAIDHDGTFLWCWGDSGGLQGNAHLITLC